MSINSAMLAGVSGLLANSSSLAAISDNIANVNTVGYKRSSANFSSMVTSQSKNGSYSAGGVGAKTHQFISQQGLSQATTSSLDLSISGAGFFVTTEKPEGLSPTDTRSFTRAGSFTARQPGLSEERRRALSARMVGRSDHRHDHHRSVGPVAAVLD
jgi:flagellar hook protein FlgE